MDVGKLLDEAEAAAGQGPRPWIRARAFANLARNAAAVGDGERMVRLVERSELECARLRLEDRVWTLRTLVRACMDGGRRERAEGLARVAEACARRVRPLARRRMCLEECVRMWLLADRTDLALSVLRTLAESCRPEMAAADVAVAMAKAGMPGEALAVARGIRDPGWRSQAMRQIALAHARSGDRDACRSALEAIPEAGWRAMALGDLAEALAVSVKPDGNGA